ncbi:formate dehydrogenase accessory protein FdhE domain-containing protein [Uliginosibacterium aquaticum]|uniref:Formate dehydrogenase accessory protein FdhE n=1 Tax=Uliginosibacterium aquaticum TaxID=2731212 RepID=A0ABX2ILU9_9RHOO|nr:formate dehydrogenase accessory protein FdhE [Uliginosibacterium aquaticum]NSL55095.1 formate dehydrogenase accessory protein FdhE [Uliginosibacterium aquaticum]
MNLPEQIPSAIAPILVLAPDARLFAHRAQRLRSLAPGHALEAWLLWLAELVDAQQRALDALGPKLAAASDAALEAAWSEAFEYLRGSLAAGTGEPDPAALPARVRDNLDFARGERPAEGRSQLDLVLSAALQVVWTLLARRRVAAASAPIVQRAQCPCCGSAALGGVILAGEGRGGLRYLECALCATRWHMVRAHCSLCEADGVVDYLGLAPDAPIQAETCDACHGYIKLFFQSRDPAFDPLADDLASLLLDVLVGEQGYARGAPNLFLLSGEAA